MENMHGNYVGAQDASKHFSEWLDRVEHGEELTILKHGAPVARVIPVRRPTTSEGRRAAIAGILEIASRNRLDGLKIKDLIAEGRR